MQAAASSNLVPTDLSSSSWYGELQKQLSHGGFYQQIISGLVRGVYGQTDSHGVREQACSFSTVRLWGSADACC